MGRKLFLFLLVSSFFAALCFSQTARPQESTIRELSGEIHVTLDDLRRQSQALTVQLSIAENELRIQSSKASQLQTDLNALNSCLDDTNRKLADYSKRLGEYEAKLRRRARIIAWAAVLLFLFLLVRAILIILKVKFGIKIPYMVNLLL